MPRGSPSDGEPDQEGALPRQRALDKGQVVSGRLS